MKPWLFVVFWILVSLTHVRAVGCHQNAADANEWRYAIVFRRNSSRWEYRGIWPKPRLERKHTAIEKVRPDAESEYRVLLLRDGGMRTFNVSLKPLVVWEQGSPKTESILDCSAFEEIITKCPRIDTSVKLVATLADRPVAHASSPDGDSTLAELVANSEMVALGEVVGIWRKGYSPLNNEGPYQHTVFLFAVQSFLKADRPDREQILKIHQQGSDLPWRDREGRMNTGMVFEGSPMLTVGGRYILFLNTARSRVAIPREPVVMATVDGITGKVADWDECIFQFPLRSKIRIINGISHSAGMARDWAFDDGQRILGISEQAAVTSILQQIDLATKK